MRVRDPAGCSTADTRDGTACDDQTENETEDGTNHHRHESEHHREARRRGGFGPHPSNAPAQNPEHRDEDERSGDRSLDARAGPERSNVEDDGYRQQQGHQSCRPDVPGRGTGSEDQECPAHRGQGQPSERARVDMGEQRVAIRVPQVCAIQDADDNRQDEQQHCDAQQCSRSVPMRRIHENSLPRAAMMQNSARAVNQGGLRSAGEAGLTPETLRSGVDTTGRIADDPPQSLR